MADACMRRVVGGNNPFLTRCLDISFTPGKHGCLKEAAKGGGDQPFEGYYNMKTCYSKKLGLHTFTVLLGLVCMGCSSEDQRTRDCLVGKWGWEHSDWAEGVFSGEITFYADGKYYQTLRGGDIGATIITYLGGRSFLGRWTVENGELTLSQDNKSESKSVKIFSIDNNGSGEPLRIRIDHCDPNEILFSNPNRKWICKRK
jgi:hypothetical protein